MGISKQPSSISWRMEHKFQTWRRRLPGSASISLPPSERHRPAARRLRSLPPRSNACATLQKRQIRTWVTTSASSSSSGSKLQSKGKKFGPPKPSLRALLPIPNGLEQTSTAPPKNLTASGQTSRQPNAPKRTSRVFSGAAKNAKPNSSRCPRLWPVG